MERVVTGGTGGAELADTTRALFATRKLLLPGQSGLGDEFKRLADYLSAGGARDVRAKKGHDDRSRAIMLAVHQAFTQKAPVKPWIAAIPRNEVDDFGDGPPRWWHKS